MAQKVELRKRSGGSFAGDENLMLPVTHVNFVLGLLDVNNKLNISLLPSSMLNTKRMAGSINADTTFGSLYTSIETFNENKTAMYPGTYFISNGKNLISASTDHVIYYNDDGLLASSTVNLENGDHLFYVKYGTEHSWNNTEITVDIIPSSDNIGLTSLTAPYNGIDGRNVFYDELAMAATNPSTNGIYGLLTGYRWVKTSQSDYDSAGYQISKAATIGGTTVEADANYLAVPSWALYDVGQGNVVLKIDDVGAGNTYWRLTQVMSTPPSSPIVYQSIVHSNKHIWGVVNNTYDLATTESAGLMSATDKVKLNGLFNYVHPIYTSRSIDTEGVEVINTFTSDTSGHVTSISTRPLPSADTDNVGVVRLANTAEGRTGSSASRALTPATGLAMLKHNQDVSYFSNLTTANGATLPDGATAIIVTGEITI